MIINKYFIETNNFFFNLNESFFYSEFLSILIFLTIAVILALIIVTLS